MTAFPAVLVAVLLLGALALGLAVLVVRGRGRRTTRHYSYVSAEAPPSRRTPESDRTP